MSYVHVRLLMRTIFFRKTACQKYFFQILSQKNAQIVNLKNPDLDLIRRIPPPPPSVDFMDSWSVFGFAENTQNTFLDSEIRIWIFPEKRTLSVDIFI